MNILSSGTASPNVIAGRIYPAQALPQGFIAKGDPLDPARDEEDQLIEAQDQAYRRNQDDANQYLNATFANWLTSYTACRIPGPPNPPPVPNGLQVQVLGGNGGLGGFAYVRTGPPVCQMPSYPEVQVLNPNPAASSAPPVQDYPVNALIPNTYGIPAGTHITSANGQQWVAVELALPFGLAPMLQRIS